jgi:hypothetical protein
MEYLLYSLFSIPVIINVLLIIHVIKTDRERSWIILFFIFPVGGALIYFLTEILPDLFHHPRAEHVRGSLLKRLTAGARLKRLLRELNFSPTFANRRAAADEYFSRGEYAKAAGLYADCLKDFDSGNLEVKLALAQCRFHNGDCEAALAVLRTMRDAPGLFKKYSSDLLLARVFEKAGKAEAADKAYADIAPRYPGFEAFARYGLFLADAGNKAAARDQFAAILEQYPMLPRANRREEREWVLLARRELRRLKEA